MKIKFLGHASFLITDSRGTKILTDPYRPGGFGGKIAYGPIKEKADVVLVSHEHDDHGCTEELAGSPEVLRKSGTCRGIEFKAVPTFHDLAEGGERGRNNVFRFNVDGLALCHAGDLGHQLTEKQAKEIGKIDVLLVPVGGFFTIDAKGAAAVADSLQARVVIPMHYKTPKCGFPIAGVDEFVRGKPKVRNVKSSEIELSADSLPSQREIIVLAPAL